MTKGQRVLFNTIATYARTLLGIALGIFSGRWVLQALGQVDYGLLSVVGGLFGFIVIFNTVSATSCSRYFALAIGKGDVEETNKWFNAACFLHLVIPIVLVLVGWPIGEWAIDHFLEIPIHRLHTAHLVFRISVVSAFFAMTTSPYKGIMVAKQNIMEMSVWEILGSLLRFGSIYLMLYYTGDAWLFYAITTASISIIILLVQSFRCYYLYQECRFCIAKMIDLERIFRLFRFAGWQMLAAFSGVCRGVGMGVLINQYFPPQKAPGANASFTIGQGLSSYSNILSSALLGAFSPEITATEGRGDRALMFRYATSSSKFGTFLVALIAVPLMLEIKYVLILWLKEPPAYAWIFSLFMIAQILVENLTYGQMVSVNAVGKIGLYQCVVSGFTISALPLAWILYSCGCGVWAAGFSILLTYSVAMAARVVMARWIIGYLITPWIRQVLRPSLVIFCLSFIVGFLVKYFIASETLLRVVLVTLVSDCCIIFISWKILFDADEKFFMIRQIKKLFCRLMLSSGGVKCAL